MATSNWNKWLLGLSMLPLSGQADIGNTPVIGGLFNSTQVLKNQVVSSLSYSTRFARDTTLFTIGGMTLDAFVLTLPLDGDTKKRVISQISNPQYAIPLGYFLYQYYDRYTGISSEDTFKRYLRNVYDDQALTGFQHSLFQLSEEVKSEQNKHKKDQGHQQGIKIDDDFYAAMVTIYDALVEIGEWQDMERLPEQYQYLSDTPHDRELIAKIQPIVVGLMSQAASGMEEGDMKHALLAVIEDGRPENADKENNKAQALTITLIDFVRLNVLKAYRQFVYQDERQVALNNWMQAAFDDEPQQLIDFLESQQRRRFAVQVTVDGLQQGLVEGLVDPNKPFIQHVYRQYQARQGMEPNIRAIEPEHQQDMRFAEVLSEQVYRDPHYLPFFKRLYADHRDSIARVGISSTPTISVRNLPIIKTGAKVSGEHGTGIPNFHFVDRHEDRAYYFFGNDALQLDRIMQKNQVQTMFDRLNYLKTLNCNAQYDWNAHTSYDGLVNLGVGEGLRDFGEKRCVRELEKRAEVETQLRQRRAALIRNIRDYQNISYWTFYTKFTRKWKIEQDIEQYTQLDGQGMPDYTLIYNPWPDHFAHFVGPFSDEIIMPTGELNRLDYWIRRVEETYKDAGIYGQTLWGMAGDHGLAPVYYALNPENVVFHELEQELGYPLVVRKISSDEGEGPKITNALNYPSNQGIDVVVASTAGGNFMLDFFNSASGWQVQPVYSELTTWTPKHSQGQPIDIMAETLARLGDTLDYMAVRETACEPARCETRLIGQRGGKRLDEWVIRDGDRLFYRAENGKPRLLGIETLNPYLTLPDERELAQRNSLLKKCLSADLNHVSSWCRADEWRELTRFSNRPDSVEQIAALYEEDRAGTVNLFPREGVGYNTKVPGRHAGESYLEKDAFIGFWGAPIGQQVTPMTSEENGSLAPTIYEYLTGETVQAGENGWGYPSLLNKLDIQR